MEFLIDLNDFSLIYYPNIFFLTAIIALVCSGYLSVRIVYTVGKKIVELSKKEKGSKYSSMSITSAVEKMKFIVIFSTRLVYILQRYINKNLKYIEKKGEKIIRVVKKEIFIPCIIVCLLIFVAPTYATEYRLTWPGILPDSPLYKIKVLRNKIIERLIIQPVRRIEFDLLMADKTLYASKFLLDKKEFSLARETALKGENYFSSLVADYAKVQAANGTIPKELRVQIDSAYVAHQQLIKYLHDKAPEQDKKTYENIDFFSDENYRILQKFSPLQQQ